MVDFGVSPAVQNSLTVYHKQELEPAICTFFDDNFYQGIVDNIKNSPYFFVSGSRACWLRETGTRLDLTPNGIVVAPRNKSRSLGDVTLLLSDMGIEI